MNVNIDPYACCPYPPRSAGKVAWLAERFRLRLPLFQPGDAGEVENLGEQRGLFARMEASGDSGPTGTTEGRALVSAVCDGERDAEEVAALLETSEMAVRVAVAALGRKRRLQTA